MQALLFSNAAKITVILMVSFGVYLNALPGAFVYDDPTLIEQNPWLSGLQYLPDIFLSNAWSFDQMQSNYYRPLLFAILMLDYHIFGLDPWGYHLTNVLLHAGVSVLVFIVAARLLKQGSRHVEEQSKVSWQAALPLIAALLFALHPIHTESVAWVSGMTDVSFSLFYLLAFYLYMRADGRWGMAMALSACCFFLAALCKETALTLPIMLFAYDAVVRRNVALTVQGFLHLLKRYFPFILAAVAYFAMRTYALGEFAPVHRHQELNAYEYFINIFPLFAQYLGKLVFPVDLNVLHVFHPIVSLTSWVGLAGILATLAFMSAGYFLARRDRIAAFCLAWIAIPLLPALYIPALGENSFAERYLYLPSAGFVILVSIALLRLAIAGRRYGFVGSLALPGLMLVGVCYAVGTVERNLVWRDELSLWVDTVNKSPDAYMAHNNLGLAQIHRGELDQAAKSLEVSLRLNPSYPKAYYNFGLVHERLGQLDAAAKKFAEAVSLDPAFAKAQHNLGTVLSRQGKLAQAIQAYAEAVRIQPDFAQAHHDLGTAYAASGMLEMAQHAYERALIIAPDLAGAYLGLGNVYGRKGQMEMSADYFARAIELDTAYAEAHHNLGVILAKQGKIDQAMKEYEAAIGIKPDYAQAYHNLGAIFARKGLLKQSSRMWETVLRLTPGRVDIRYNLGVVYMKMGKVELAKKAFTQVLTKQPDHPAARQALLKLDDTPATKPD
ncbi:MAG: tetratricopeptide repeat protein [Mariprofundaceae bacterium]